MKKRLFNGLFVLIASLVLIVDLPSQCRSESKYDYGDALVRSTIGEASNLIPFLASDSASHEISDLIYNGLVKYDGNLMIVGDLAESFKISNDGLKITFILKHGVQWHDGREFTADDCVFTYNVITDPKTPTPYAGDFLQVKRVSAPDKRTFVVEYKEPFAPALSSWGISIVPKHLLEGADITRSPLRRKPVGTGPYIFHEWVAGERIVLKANDKYFEGRPYIASVIFRVIPDTATTFLELKSEGVDLSALTPFQYSRQSSSGWFENKYNKYKYLSFSYTYLGFNLKRKPFEDIKVRKAIAHAINKKEIIQGVLLGLGVEATGPYKPDMFYYSPDVEMYPYSPETAVRLLEEAGYHDTGSTGIREKNGIPLQFTVITNQGNDSRIKTAEIIQKRLRNVGISMKIVVMEWAAFIKEFINPRRFEAVILGWTIPQDPDLFDIWHSSKIEKNGLNLYSYSNPAVDRLLLKGRKMIDRKKRKEIYSAVQKIIADDVPCVFLYVPNALPVVHKRFRGVEPLPAGIGYNMYKWYVPKAEHKY